MTQFEGNGSSTEIAAPAMKSIFRKQLIFGESSRCALPFCSIVIADHAALFWVLSRPFSALVSNGFRILVTLAAIVGLSPNAHLVPILPIQPLGLRFEGFRVCSSFCFLLCAYFFRLCVIAGAGISEICILVFLVIFASASTDRVLVGDAVLASAPTQPFLVGLVICRTVPFPFFYRVLPPLFSFSSVVFSLLSLVVTTTILAIGLKPARCAFAHRKLCPWLKVIAGLTPLYVRTRLVSGFDFARTFAPPLHPRDIYRRLSLGFGREFGAGTTLLAFGSTASTPERALVKKIKRLKAPALRAVFMGYDFLGHAVSSLTGNGVARPVQSLQRLFGPSCILT